jgi:SET and MYND domain-containing protein 4
MSSLLKSGSVHIALRIFYISLSAFNGSIEKLQEFIEENEKTNSTVFDFDFSTGSPEEAINYLKCLASLSRSTKVFPLYSYEEILSNHPEMKNIWQTHKTFIKEFLLRICQTNDLYFHGIFSGSLKRNTSDDQVSALKSLQQSIGTGWFPFCSLINHSCSPNVIRMYVEGQVALIVCRPIENGSQLFDCYK